MPSAFEGMLRRIGLESVADGQGPLNFWKRAPKVFGSQQNLWMQDFVIDASSGLAIGAHSVVGSDGNDVVVPNAAIVVGGGYYVSTTFTSAADTATIALHLESANDIVSAVAINNGGNPWDAGGHDIVPDMTGSTAVKMTEARTLTCTVATQALTAGVLRGWLLSIMPYNHNPYA